MAKKKASTTKQTKNKGGRPPVFTQEHKEVMLRLAGLQYTNEQMANIIGCSKDTFYRWLKEDPELSDSLKAAKEKTDALVEQSLFNKAVGNVTVTERTSGICPDTGNLIETVKTKEVPPSDTAMIFWLKNRRPDRWREKQEVELNTGKEGLRLAYNIDPDDN